jgi:hypothetical protein
MVIGWIRFASRSKLKEPEDVALARSRPETSLWSRATTQQGDDDDDDDDDQPSPSDR